MTVLAVTGHRPDKLGGYDDATRDALFGFAKHVFETRAYRELTVISGMALGWDQAVAEVALHYGVPLTVALPFAGYESRWPKAARKRFYNTVERATRFHIVCEGGYAAWKMQKRNEWMVDKSDRLLALWNGSPGGTSNCVEYAADVGKSYENVWNEWLDWKRRHGL